MHIISSFLCRRNRGGNQKKIAKNNALFFQSLIMIQVSNLWQRSRQNLDKANSLCAKYTMSFTLASFSMNNILHISYREVFAIFLLRFNILHICIYIYIYERSFNVERAFDMMMLFARYQQNKDIALKLYRTKIGN